MPIPIIKEIMKSKMDVPPKSMPLSLEESGKNPDWSLITTAKTSTM